MYSKLEKITNKEAKNEIQNILSTFSQFDGDESIESDLENETDENIKESLKIFNYNAYKNHNILNICHTENNLIMLLSNGTCVTWGLNRSTLGRKCNNSSVESSIPTPLKFQKKIVDIVCGRNYCLAKAKNYSVFSWGQNNYGQLGLGKIVSEIDEPKQIHAFDKIKINQIFASGNTSFAISAGGNNIFGWGQNKDYRLGLSEDKSYFVPKIIDLNKNFVTDLFIYQNKDGSKNYLAEMVVPFGDLTKSMIFFNNKLLCEKEKEVLRTRKSIEFQRDLIMKNRAIVSLRGDWKLCGKLVDEISYFKMIYKNKLNSCKSNFDPMKLERIENLFKLYENDSDKSNTEHLNNSIEPAPTNTMEGIWKVKEKGNQNIKMNVNRILSKNKIINSAEYKFLRKELEIQNKKIEYLKEILDTCESMKETALKLVQEGTYFEKMKDLSAILNKIQTDHKLLKNCQLQNLKSLDTKSNSIQCAIIKSHELLTEREKEIDHYNIDKDNKYGRNIINMFKKNISLTRQNNNLLDKLMVYTNLHYKDTLKKDLDMSVRENSSENVLKIINEEKSK